LTFLPRSRVKKNNSLGSNTNTDTDLSTHLAPTSIFRFVHHHRKPASSRAASNFDFTRRESFLTITPPQIQIQLHPHHRQDARNQSPPQAHPHDQIHRPPLSPQAYAHPSNPTQTPQDRTQKLTPPSTEIDHTPQVHPASPSESLPESFASYRQKASQHGPMMRSNNSGASQAPSVSQALGGIGGSTARQLGSVQPKEGEFWDRNELPVRFRRTVYSDAEMEAIESGGASLF
jgi:small subunit ribosomal protein YMR-31